MYYLKLCKFTIVYFQSPNKLIAILLRISELFTKEINCNLIIETNKFE